MSYLLIALGGALGALARFLIAQFMAKYVCYTFPCGTLTVNIVGSFFITLFMIFFISSSADPLWRLFFVVGFLGAFTTLSSITYDTITFLKEGSYFLAFLNLFCNLFFSLFAGFAGLVLGKVLFLKGG